MQIMVIDAGRVREILTMPACIEALDTAMRAISRGDVAAPPRLFAPHANGGSVLALMPGSAKDLGVYGAKVLSVHPANRERGLPMIQGFVVLFDGETGAPKALIDGAELTAIRTAAASALATRELARQDARTHGIFGTGVQAVTHLDAIAAVRSIERTVVCGRDPRKTAEFARVQRRRTGSEVVPAETPEAAAACDIVSTVTTSKAPVLSGNWLRPGAHVNLVGAHSPDAREADSDLIAAARVFVDLRDAVLEEAGDLLIPIEEGRISADHIVGEIGQLLDREIGGRQSASDITAYKSVGTVGQDLGTAAYVFDQVVGS